MSPLTIADTLRWNPEAVRGVESAINKHGATAQEVSDALYKLPLFQSWEGESGSAAKESLDKLSKYLVAHADEMESLGKALGKAAVEIENVRKELRELLNKADEYGMDIDPVSGAVKITAAANIGLPATTIALHMSELQNDIKNVLAHAESVDQALASAINGSGTTTPTAKHGSGTPEMPALLKGLGGDKPVATNPADALPGSVTSNYAPHGAVTEPKPEQKPVYDPKTLGTLGGTTNFIEANRKPEAKPDDKPAPQSKGFIDGWVDAAKQKAEGIVEHAGDLVGLHGSEKAKDAWIDVGVGAVTDALKHSIPGGDTPSAMDQTIDAYNKVQDAKAHGGSGASLAGAGLFDMQARSAEATAAIATGGTGRFLERGLVEGAIGAEGRAALSEGVPTLDSALHNSVKGMLDNALHGHVETPPAPHIETPSVPHADAPATPHVEVPATPHVEPPRADAPAPSHIETPSAPHTPQAVDHTPTISDHPTPPLGEHSLPPADHPSPLTVDHPTPVDPPFRFDPNSTDHGYSSDNPYHPGDWPPHTPEPTYGKDGADHGWQNINRGPDKPWMDYQSQITGIERTPEGHIPEYTRIDPQTGREVHYDGPTIRNGQEIYLDAKRDYSMLVDQADKPWVNNIRNGLLEEVDRQYSALPDGAELEWHVSNPASAAAIRTLLDDGGFPDVKVIYTPEVP
ncbi:Alpha/beta hydrolase of uncharacterised function (DUF1023) [Mycobacteroides abscessus subsp. abscessus]|uniref:Tox-REase-5 domain-containing protein n=1 Tax=Mycobacteroides abscessus TaxID=36809 RepID=UPI000927451C|nr:Tox-REase-5 domain-containing protein [Mycobacteroides abscessus]SHU42229.1 Alpha/beta hydrolase of uncharacterised function (DUF1023) [Mycobacteroides abscessus subsp. abscessus]SHV12996.1 Alpha/beta hydrolase of uncharacterised function (DUF1023) [Mycobacteroides abscessus subsp. abscessus]